MYSNCIFCSNQLGRNEALEHFPVGRRLAFDGWHGRLWAICPRCGRWNLAPIEERWEPVEAAEKAFRQARLRVQSENIGMARLPDGTDLIRVGEALPGELAAWRYGDRLLRRRKRYLLLGGAAAAAGLGMAGLWVTGTVGLFGLLIVSDVVKDLVRKRGTRRTVHLLRGDDSPLGRPLRVQEAHLRGGRLELDAHDRLLVHLPAHRARWGSLLAPRLHALPELTLHDDQARGLVRRAMVHVNERGGSRRVVDTAVERLVAAGEPELLVREVARKGLNLGDALAAAPLLEFPGIMKIKRTPLAHREIRLRRRRRTAGALQPPELLALEMALNEESERRAMAGELALLEAAWREAEEIAAIADALPEGPALSRLEGSGARGRSG